MRRGTAACRTGSHPAAPWRRRSGPPAATGEITACGAGSVQVTRRLLAACDALAASVPAARRPLLIALADIGLHDGTMLPANAAALVGAGVLSVLFYPSIAAVLHKRGQRGGRPGGAAPGPAAAQAICPACPGDAEPGRPGPATH